MLATPNPSRVSKKTERSTGDDVILDKRAAIEEPRNTEKTAKEEAITGAGIGAPWIARFVLTPIPIVMLLTGGFLIRVKGSVGPIIRPAATSHSVCSKCGSRVGMIEDKALKEEINAIMANISFSRIVVFGDEHVGKNYIINKLINTDFPSVNVPRILEFEKNSSDPSVLLEYAHMQKYVTKKLYGDNSKKIEEAIKNLLEEQSRSDAHEVIADVAGTSQSCKAESKTESVKELTSTPAGEQCTATPVAQEFTKSEQFLMRWLSFMKLKPKQFAECNQHKRASPRKQMKCPPTLSDASLDHKVHNRNTNGRRETAVSEVAPFTLTLAFEHGRSEIIDHKEIQLYAALHVVFNSFGTEPLIAWDGPWPTQTVKLKGRQLSIQQDKRHESDTELIRLGTRIKSHGGEALMVSNGFEFVAKSEQRAVVAVEYDGGRFYGTLSGTSVMSEDIQALYHDGYNKLRSQTDSSLELYEMEVVLNYADVETDNLDVRDRIYAANRGDMEATLHMLDQLKV
ncbi:hypothetical protein Tco_0546028 [Tanacetum coccineum]